MTGKYLITGSLPYANGDLHIGHAVEYIQADIYVRFLKLLGRDAIYIDGSDTHGTPVELNAKKQGVKPDELVARYSREHLADLSALGIKFDSWYTTNSKENRAYTDQIFNTLKKNGLIYTKKVKQTYCEKCKRFLPDRFVKGGCPKCGAEDQYGDVCEKCNTAYKPVDLKRPYCVTCGEKPTRKESLHYFFKLSAKGNFFKKWFKENKNLQPEIKNYLLNWIKEGLQDWDISRDAPYFGFKIPGEKDKYYYVWLDAPVGYIASTANYCKGKKCDPIKDYWKNPDTKIIHFIGKDIIYFHYLFWPAMLEGAGFNLPYDIPVHGFLTVNGEKMSKSRGTYYSIRDYLKLYDPEYLRFYYAKNLSRKLQDIDLDFSDFVATVNNELVANIANFVYRTLSFVNKNFDSKIGLVDNDFKLTHKLETNFVLAKDAYERMDYKSAVKRIMECASMGNRYFQGKEPWKLVKEDKKEAHKILGLCANIVKDLAILLRPILPKFSSDVFKQLNIKPQTWRDLDFSLKNHKIRKVEPLIKKTEVKQKEILPFQLRVGKILDVKNHPEAEKLYLLKVDLGSLGKRQLVAGLKQFYKPSGLKGKKIVVVANLKPAKLRGALSEGMLLAAESKGGKIVEVLELSKARPGAGVVFGDYGEGEGKIDIQTFMKTKITVGPKGEVLAKGTKMHSGSEEIRAKKVKSGRVR